MPTLLITSLFLILSFEGLGVPYGREISYFLILFSSIILIVRTFFQKKKIIFPKLLTVLFLIFLVSSFTSSLLSQNVPKTIFYSFYQIPLFLFLICAYNYQKQVEKQLYVVIFGCSALFSSYFLLLYLNFFKLFIPSTGYQFVFSYTASHAHLGDFLIIPTMLLLYNLYHKRFIKVSVAGIFVLLPFTIFSFSRSAYVSIAVSSLVLHVFSVFRNQIPKRTFILRIVILLIVLGSVFAFIMSTSQLKNKSSLSTIYAYLVQNNNLSNNKDLVGRRPYYFRQAIDSFLKNPLMGIGPNNFHSVSLTYAKKPYLESTETVHNIFLEVLVGQGIFGLLPFTGLILLFLIKSQKNALFFAMLAMLFNFQTDYTYQIYSFFLLLFVIAGTIYDENHTINPKPSSS